MKSISEKIHLESFEIFVFKMNLGKNSLAKNSCAIWQD